MRQYQAEPPEQEGTSAFGRCSLLRGGADVAWQTRPVSTTTAPEAPASRPQRLSQRIPFAAVIVASVVVCALLMALPDTFPWWPLKFVAAVYTLLLVPGATILRIIGWPRSPATALAASAAWSIVALAPGFALVFVLDRGLDVALWWLVLVVVVALVVGRGKPVAMDLRIDATLLLLIATVVGFAALAAAARHHNFGDSLEHVGRLRKLTELMPPRGLTEINLLPPSTGLHPGYAFPMWHGFIGLVTRLSGIDEAVAFRTLPSVLIPVVAAAIYRSGRSMFGTRAAGVATWLAFLAVFAFPDRGVGIFDRLSYPGWLSVFLLWPLVLDRTFDYLDNGGREPPWTIAAASFIVTAIHASYAPLMIMVLGAFAVVRFLTVRDRAELRPLAIVMAAVTVPFLLMLIWVYPVAKTSGSTVLYRDTFRSLLDRSDGLQRIKPGYVTRGGAAALAALLLAPLAAAAARTRAASFIGAGTALVILTLIVSFVFTPYADIMSVSQGRRLLYYLPWAFALVGAALILGRFRYYAVAGALAAGTALQLWYPGDFEYKMAAPGPGWVAWISALACLVVLGLGIAGRLNLRYASSWALPIVIAFVAPIAAAGIPDARFGRTDDTGLPPTMMDAVSENVDRDDVLMAPRETAYRLTGHLPIYVVAVTPAHGGDTLINRHEERRLDVRDFFERNVSPEEGEAILERWDPDWLLVDKRMNYPEEVVAGIEPVFEGGTYALYPLEDAEPSS